MKHIFQSIFLKIFKIYGVVFISNDSSSYDRFVWLKNNLIPAKENGKFLDVGCGNGWAMFLATKYNYKSIGLTNSKEDVNKILKKAKSINLEINTVIADTRNLDKIFLSDHFDVIVNLETIEHIINAEELISNISNKLKNGGLLYLTTPNILYRKLSGDSIVNEVPVEDGNHVVRGYSIVRLERILKKNNLFIISKTFLSGPFSMILINLDRKCHFLYLRVIMAPFVVIANLLDRIFFKNNENNLSIAIIAEKIL
jgi:2-polyprenyl-3-methyl-5-hydroxy-6-metoxy-1,4-benzoquinol methylase